MTAVVISLRAKIAYAASLLRLLDPGPNGRGADNRFEEYVYAWHNGLRWALSRGGWRRGVVVVLRELWLTYVRGHIGEICWFCGRLMPLIWWASNDLWERFSGNSGVCCPMCFDARAEDGGCLLVWQPLVRFENGAENAETTAAVWNQP